METTSHINNPAYWRQRAAHMRNLANETKEMEAKRIMLQVAHEYDKLGDRAERRSKGEKV